MFCNQGVAGSTPAAGTNVFKGLQGRSAQYFSYERAAANVGLTYYSAWLRNRPGGQSVCWLTPLSPSRLIELRLNDQA